MKNKILCYNDYRDKSFKKWENEGIETLYAGRSIFITDEINSTYGIEESFVNSSYFSAFASIVNAIYPTQNVTVIRGT